MPATDKVPPSSRSTAHTTFQNLALAYAVLSDPIRRKTYDTTGSTSETLSSSSDSFNWSEYFRAQYTDTVSVAKINELKLQYQGSNEEKQDVLQAYESGCGNLDTLFEQVLFSDLLEDEEGGEKNNNTNNEARYKSVINTAISTGQVEEFPAWKKETSAKMKARRKKARGEAKEAEELARELGLDEKLYGKARGPKSNGNDNDNGTNQDQDQDQAVSDSESALKSLIQQRHKIKGTSFLDALEAKYVNDNNAKAKSKSKSKGNSKGKTKTKTKRNKDGETGTGMGKGAQGEIDHPPEEAFARIAARKEKRGGGRGIEGVGAESDDKDDDGGEGIGEGKGKAEGKGETPRRNKRIRVR